MQKLLKIIDKTDMEIINKTDTEISNKPAQANNNQIYLPNYSPEQRKEVLKDITNTYIDELIATNQRNVRQRIPGIGGSKKITKRNKKKSKKRKRNNKKSKKRKRKRKTLRRRQRS